MHLVKHHLEPQGMEPGPTLRGVGKIGEAEPHPKSRLLLTLCRPLFGLKFSTKCNNYLVFNKNWSLVCTNDTKGEGW